MWARTMEFAFGCWLAMSPFIFLHGEAYSWIWYHDFLVGAFICVVALLSCIEKLKRLHLLHILTGGWLVLSGYVLATHKIPPEFQNHVVLGWLLIMFAIIPTDASRPPEGWRVREMEAEKSI